MVNEAEVIRRELIDALAVAIVDKAYATKKNIMNAVKAFNKLDNGANISQSSIKRAVKRLREEIKEESSNDMGD